MTDQSDILAQLSTALAARAAAARDLVVAIRSSGARHLTGTIWQSELIVASEQSLPKRDRFDVTLPGGTATENCPKASSTKPVWKGTCEPALTLPPVTTSARRV